MTKPTKSSGARVLKSKLAFRGPLFKVVTEKVVEPGGCVVRRDVVRHPGSVVILAVEGRGETMQILLERQYRHSAGRFLWELPAGKVDAGESEPAAARRELLEETGCTARRWRPILNFYVSPGFLDERMRVFLATGLRRGKAQPEPDERIEVRFVKLERALAMARGGKIRDAKTLAGLFWLALSPSRR